MLIHGGPQGFWGHAWTYRWNAQVFAAAGYVVVMPNPRGSTGYGQKFIDEINNDWGGRAFDDIMAVADHVVANLPYADGPRLTAAGASYGGYMIDWILGHTQRFKALVTHDGVYDLRQRIRRHRGALVPALGVRRHAVGQARGVRQVVPQQLTSRSSRRRRSSSTASRISASRTRRACSSSPRCKCKRSRPSCCSSPTKATGSSSRRTASSGTRPLSIGSIPG